MAKQEFNLDETIDNHSKQIVEVIEKQVDEFLKEIDSVYDNDFFDTTKENKYEYRRDYLDELFDSVQMTIEDRIDEETSDSSQESPESSLSPSKGIMIMTEAEVKNILRLLEHAEYELLTESDSKMLDYRHAAIKLRERLKKC